MPPQPLRGTSQSAAVSRGCTATNMGAAPLAIMTTRCLLQIWRPAASARGAKTFTSNGGPVLAYADTSVVNEPARGSSPAPNARPRSPRCTIQHHHAMRAPQKLHRRHRGDGLPTAVFIAATKRRMTWVVGEKSFAKARPMPCCAAQMCVTSSSRRCNPSRASQPVSECTHATPFAEATRDGRAVPGSDTRHDQQLERAQQTTYTRLVKPSPG